MGVLQCCSCALSQSCCPAQTERPLLVGDGGVLVTRPATPFLEWEPGGPRGDWREKGDTGGDGGLSSTSSSSGTEKIGTAAGVDD